MYEGYGFFSQTEIWNHNRLFAYMRGDPLNGVPGLRQPSTSLQLDCACESGQPLFCDQGSGPNGEYVSVEADDAPWYDPLVPESVEFAGLFVESVDGFGSPVRRNVREGAISGSSLGPLRLAGRTLTVTGWLRAKTCCAAEYGLQWLTEALIGGTACADCSLGDLFMLKCCPPDSDSDCHIGEGATYQFRTQDGFSMSVTDLGGGQYTVTIDDADQINLVSDPEGLANNSDGFLGACLDGVDTGAIATFNAVLDGNNTVTEFRFPYPMLVGVPVYVNNGTGVDMTFTIDTTIALPTGCADTLPVADVTAGLDEVIALFGDGVLGDAITTGEGRCQSFEDGPDPFRYERLMHRVGLVSGPTVIDRFGNCCQADCGCTNLKVTFTLASELPYLFSDIKWCVENATFPRTDVFCIDFEWCRDCTNATPTQTIEVERPRPECRVAIRYDETWCPDGWDPSELGFPPADCLLVPVIEEFTPPSLSNTSGSGSGDPCTITLNADFSWDADNFDPAVAMPPENCSLSISTPNGDPFLCSDQDDSNCTSGGGGDGNVECVVDLVGIGSGSGTWTATGFDPAVDGFPPPGCTLVYDVPCTDPDTETECPVRLIYNVATGAQTWESIGPDNGCDCYVITETCIEGDEQCLVKVIYNAATGEATWEPIRWDGDINNPACVCFVIAEVEVLGALDPADDCPPVALVDCEITLTGYDPVANKGTYTRDNWTWDSSDGDFPPADCNITIPGQDTSPVLETITVPGDLFVPDCGPTPLVPPPPFIPAIECYCEPWATFRICCTFTHQVLWNDATSYIQIDAGSAEIRNLKLQAYQNPFAEQGLPCPCDPQDDFWRCREPCSTILIPQLPSGSSLVLDGRTRVSEVVFAGGKRTNGLRYIETGGMPFEWFDISQCATLCIIVSADCATIADDAQVSIGFVERYLASGT